MLTQNESESHPRGEGVAPERVASPSGINLPKGGGAIRGIGEKFAAHPVTGTGSLTIPISTSPGRSGFGPQLALAYDSGFGNGPFGVGWNLMPPAINPDGTIFHEDHGGYRILTD